MTQPRILQFARHEKHDAVYLESLPLPFTAARVLTISNVSGGEREYDGYACREQQQLLVPVKGRVFALVEQAGGFSEKHMLRSDDQRALLVPPLTWLTLRMSPTATLLLLTGGVHNENDYLRDRQEWESPA